jgi:hypothetical protein
MARLRVPPLPVSVSPEAILLTRDQAAELCQVSLETLDGWIRLPGFPVIRGRGHLIRIHREALVDWTREYAVASNPRPVHELVPTSVPVPAPARRTRGGQLPYGR